MSFAFRQRSGALSWERIGALNIDEIVSNSSLGALQELIDMVTFSQVDVIDLDRPKPAMLNLIHISQLMLEYLLSCQEQQASRVRALYYKCMSFKQKCKKMESANLRMREDLDVYQSELSVLRKVLDASGGTAKISGGLSTGAKDGASDVTVRKAAPPRVLQPPVIPMVETAEGKKLERGQKDKNWESAKPAVSDVALVSVPNHEINAEGDTALTATVTVDDTMKAYISRLLDQQCELIEQKVLNKESVLQLQLEATHKNWSTVTSATQEQVTSLKERMESLSDMMQNALAILKQQKQEQEHAQVDVASTTVSSSSPFRKKARSSADPDQSSGGLGISEHDIHSTNASGNAIGKPVFQWGPGERSPTVFDSLQAAAEEGYSEDQAYLQAITRNSEITKREQALASKEAALLDREKHVHMMEQALKASNIKLEREKDSLELGQRQLQNAMLKASPSPDRHREVNSRSTGTDPEVNDLDFSLSPSPVKMTTMVHTTAVTKAIAPPKKDSLVLPKSPDAVTEPLSADSSSEVSTPQNRPPKKPRSQTPGSISHMSTSTTTLESLKAAEELSAKKQQRKKNVEMGAKIIKARLGQASRYRMSRGFRKWLGYTVEAREVENYHLQFEAERKAEVAAALLARGREKERQLAEQLKLEREELKRKDEEMHARLEAERQREKVRYEALLAEAEQEKRELERERAEQVIAASGGDVVQAFVVPKVVPDQNVQPVVLEPAPQTTVEPSKPVKPSRGSAVVPVAALAPENEIQAITISKQDSGAEDGDKQKPEKPARPASPGPRLLPAADKSTAATPSKPTKPIKASTAPNSTGKVPEASQLKSSIEGKQADIASDVGLTKAPPKEKRLRYKCVYTHGAFVRDIPSRNAANVGEIDEGDIVQVTGTTETEEYDGGLTYVELVRCAAFPRGGWVPLISKAGHLVLEPYAGTPEKSSSTEHVASGSDGNPKGPNVGTSASTAVTVDELLEDVEDLSLDETDLFQRAQNRIAQHVQAVGSSGSGKSIP